MAADSKNISTEQRDKSVKTISRHIEDAIELQRDFGTHAKGTVAYFLHFGKTRGTYVTMLYLVVKLLYVANVIGQFFLLNAFLGTRYYFWGAKVLTDLAHGIEWEETGHFPRVTLCDFEVRVLGNLHRYTIQCVLMINMFNEKIFLFLWWWFLFVMAATIINLCFWLVISISPQTRFAFITRFLRISDCVSPGDSRAVQKFVSHALRPDGVFMLRMISNHAGDLAATEITHNLWSTFRIKLIKPFKTPELIADFKEGGEKAGLLTDIPGQLKTPPGGFNEFIDSERLGLIPPDANRQDSGISRERAPSYEKATSDDVTFTSSV